LSSTGASAKLAVVWKGSLTGTVAGKTYAGKASYSPTMVSGSTATGSFAGATKLTLPFPGSAVSGCTSRRGIKKLTLTGTITLGTIATPPGPPAASLISDLKGYCALLTSGSVDCWGDNTVGQLGNGTIGSPNPTPGAVTGITTATSLDSDFSGTCALLTSGSVDCWGDNTVGQLGNGTTGSPNPTPGAVSGVTTATSLATQGSGYCALLTSGSVDCWGDNIYGELGNGTIGSPNPTPGAVTGITTATSLASDGGGYCAVLTSGSVDCWGYNGTGDLGNGTAGSPNTTPGAVTGITTATSLASDARGDGYCAVLTSGSVDCWGDNTSGDLGNGTTTGPDCSGTCNPTPGAVTGITTATSLASDYLTGYCAVLASGSVDCWGDNTYGELGNGTTGSPNPTPGAVSGVTTATHLGTDGTGYCALLASGSGDCWGDNTVGELGNGTTGSPNPTPGAVSGVTTATSGTSDFTGYCVVLTSGSVDCWGDNTYGELGNGTTGSPNPTPGAVSGIGP